MFGYDFENRLKSITIPGVLTETYVYDYAGELLRRTTSQGTINYAYGQGVAPLAELKNFGPVAETDYLQVNGKTVGAMENGHNGRARDTFFYHTDGIGSVLGITDGTGSVVASELYDPFGVILANTTPNNVSNAYQFVGTYGVRHIDLPGNNPNITFNHSIMGVRMYDASVGRFISEDPVGIRGGDINLYRYVQGNSLLLVDPTGLKSWLFSGGSLSLLNDDGSIEKSFSAVSGTPHGQYGPLLAGPYKIGSPPVDVTPQTNPNDWRSFCDVDGNCWWVPIFPNNFVQQPGLGIHPDGGPPGTKGCIGAKGPTSELRKLMSQYWTSPLVVK